jgi:hypothetical protein
LIQCPKYLHVSLILRAATKPGFYILIHGDVVSLSLRGGIQLGIKQKCQCNPRGVEVLVVDRPGKKTHFLVNAIVLKDDV